MMMKVTYTALAAGSNVRGDKVCIVTGSDGNTMTLNRHWLGDRQARH
jgi:hypothetical protein